MDQKWNTLVWKNNYDLIAFSFVSYFYRDTILSANYGFFYLYAVVLVKSCLFLGLLNIYGVGSSLSYSFPVASESSHTT